MKSSGRQSVLRPTGIPGMPVDGALPAIAPPMNRSFLLPGALGVALCTSNPASTAPDASAARKVREPAVAGLFYPRDAAALSRVIETNLAAAKTARTGTLKALICPHAGYDYSGPVAASGFRLLQGAGFDTVILLAPSHYAALRAASVSDADVYRTPLGDVPISPKARLLAQFSPFALEPRCHVQRPGWTAQSSRRAPPDGTDRADTWEHADEVEVPFLQKTLAKFELLPVVFGDVDPAAAAPPLQRILDDRTLIVVSSDLSHYHPYAEARQRDQRCIDAICALDPARLSGQEACGLTPLLTLLHIARQQAWKPVLLDYRNSGDTAGDKSRVVGYAAIAFYAAAPETFSAADRRFLLELARRAVRAVVTTGRTPDLPVQALSPALTAPRGCFVTLKQQGALRGCIGHIGAQMPLHRAVIENAASAAARDPRFLPVAPREVDGLKIEISVLTVPQPLPFKSPEDLLRQLQPHRDGVVLRIAGRLATYLPQVWENIPDRVDFLNSLAEKAGGAPDAWRGPDVSVSIYHVESFQESDGPT